jgi:DMSO/TMAO reductase YedYZ molybdopterin-dependent catalytic subunit
MKHTSFKTIFQSPHLSNRKKYIRLIDFLKGLPLSRYLYLMSIICFIVLFISCGGGGEETTNSTIPTTVPATTEVEATEFQGTKLTPISEQGNAASSGTQFIDKNTYILTVDGLVDHPLTLSYADLLAYPQESRLMDLNCVDDWNFTAKWTGPELNSIFNDADVKPEAKIAIFYTADFPTGYSSLDLNYIRDNNIIIALKDNDITLPPDRGFPFQVVAQSKYGYEWAKWVTRIELSSKTSLN